MNSKCLGPEFSKICKLYPKCILSGNIITFDNVIQTLQNMCVENMQNCDENYLDKIRMFLVIAAYNDIKIKSNFTIHNCLQIVDELKIEDEEKIILLNNISVLLTITQDSHLNDIYTILNNVSESEVNQLQKLKIVYAIVASIQPEMHLDTDLQTSVMNLCAKIMLQVTSKPLRSILIIICEKLVALSGDTSFILPLWENLKQDCNNDDKLSVSLDIMCNLSNLYLLSEHNVFNSIINDHLYWKFLNYGIRLSHNLYRKQSMYLLKRTIDICIVSNKQISVPESLKSLFYWNDENQHDLEQNWLTYFLIMDSLDEKSSHIVMPAMKLIYSLKSIPDLWMDALICKILNHDTDVVKRYGIIYAVKFLTANCSYNLESHNLIQQFLAAINNTKMYNEQNDKHEDIFPYLIEFFQNTGSKILIPVTSINWAPVPFFYISYALAKSEPYDNFVLEPETFLSLFQKVMRASLNCPNTYIRSAIQKNIILYYTKNFIKLNHAKQIPEIMIHIFQELDSVTRGTQMWTILEAFATKLHSQNYNIYHMLTDSLTPEFSVKQIIYFLILGLDARMLKQEEFKRFLSLYFNYFLNCETRMYASQENQTKAVDMAILLLRAIKSEDLNTNDTTKTIVASFLFKYIKSIFKYTEIKMISCKCSQDLEIFEKCIHFIKECLSNNYFDDECESNVDYLTDVCINKLSNQCSFIEKYANITLLTAFAQNYYEDKGANKNHNKNIVQIQKIYHSVLCHRNISNEDCKSCDIARSGKIASNYHKNFCNILCKYLRVTNASNDENLLNYVEDVLDFGGHDVVLDAMKVLKNIVLYKNLQAEHIEKIVNRCWIESMNLKKSDLFLPCMQAFIGKLKYLLSIRKQFHVFY